MNLRRRVLLVPALLLAVTGFVLGTSLVAHATGNQVCGNGGSGYCLDDWGGANGAVKMANGGGSHENFGGQAIDRCAGGDVVTATCPSTNHTFDAAHEGELIVQLLESGGNCVGSDGFGDAIMATCNNVATGSGGGTGTVFVVNASTGVFFNSYWTGQGGIDFALESGGSYGAQAYISDVNFTDWGWTLVGM